MYRLIEYGPLKIGQYSSDFIPCSQKKIGENRFGPIIKQIDRRGILDDIQYSYERNMFVFLRGHIKDDWKTFHLESFNNIPFIRKDAFSLLMLLDFAEKDLKVNGIDVVEADCVRRLFPVATKRYSFIRKYESLSDRITKIVYWVILNLKKKKGEKIEMGIPIMKYL